MGACSISMTVKGDATREEVMQAFRNRQDSDRSYWLCEHDDDGDGYTGDFQTVSTVKFADKEFENEDEAMDYCLDNAQKWTNVIAVKVKASEIDPYWLVAGWGAE